MADQVRVSAQSLVEQARQRGLDLSPERADQLRPGVENLLDRLNQFAELVPRDVAPPPTPAPR
jgi:hypothetical protein